MKKWDYLVEADKDLRDLERNYRASGEAGDKEAYLAGIMRYANDRYLWANYTEPLHKGVLKLLTGKRKLVSRGDAARVAEHYSGEYRPDRKSIKARVKVRVFRDNEPPTHIKPGSNQFDTLMKHHLYGRLHVEMEFGRMTRPWSRMHDIPMQWDCEGSVSLWTWGPETDHSNFADGVVPHSRYKQGIKLWKPKELLDTLYNNMSKACKFSQLVRRYGIDNATGNLKVPDEG